MSRKYKAEYIVVKRKQPEVKLIPIVNPDYDRVQSIHAFTVRDLDLQPVKLDKYAGHICIVVVMSSKTRGFAHHNLKILNHIYDRFHNRGLRILAFPCNQFNNEEPGSNEDIKKYIHDKNIKFDVFDKVNVNCDDAHPLWKYLKISVDSPTKQRVIKDPWTKFLVGRSGVPFVRLPPGTSEDDIVKHLIPLYSREHGLKMKKSEYTIELPPPLEEDKRPCMEPWHFEPGILTLI